MSVIALPEPEPEAVPSGGSGSDSTAGPPRSGGSDDGGSFGWLRRLLLRLLSRRFCNLTGFVARETALHEAEDRASRVRDWLRDERGEFMQYPPTIRRWERPSREQGRGHRVALEWQLARPELTLLGRACDAVDALVRDVEESAAPRSSGPPLLPVVTLRRLPRLAIRISGNAYPWRVLIESNQHHEVRARLGDLQEWWGIAVHVRRGQTLRRLGCRAPGGREGVVGGYIKASVGVYGLTCGHVVGPGCTAAQLRSEPSEDIWSPDATLLRSDGCFPVRGEPAQVRGVGWGKASRLAAKGAVAEFKNAHGKVISGRVRAASLYASDLEGPLRFPTVTIARERTKYFGVAWPPFRGAFSSPGDSGSWVSTVVEDERQWLGMIVSGGNHQSLAHDASALLRWIDLELSGSVPLPQDTDWFEERAMTPYVATASL